MRKFFLTFCILFFFFRAVAFAAITYPNYTNYVNDFAHVLSSPTVTQLNTKLADFDNRTSNQIAVVTVNSTAPETIEEYGIHLADKWKVGQKGKDNGVIMIFAMQDHKMRIEVGTGLEGDLTDLQANDILTKIITPEFKKGNYDSGISRGVDGVIATITHTPMPSQSPSSPQNVQPLQQGDISTFAILLIIIIIMTLGIGFSPFTPLGGRGTWGATTFWGGGGTGGSGGGFGGFGGGGFSGGGSSSSW